MGYGVPLIAASGVLTGTILGLGPAVLMGLFPAAVSALKTSADFSEAKALQQQKPFYFLWKASR